MIEKSKRLADITQAISDGNKTFRDINTYVFDNYKDDHRKKRFHEDLNLLEHQKVIRKLPGSQRKEGGQVTFSYELIGEPVLTKVESEIAMEFAESLPDEVRIMLPDSPEQITPRLLFSKELFDQGFIPWHGGPNPYKVQTLIDVQFRGDDGYCQVYSDDLIWTNSNTDGDIIKHRVHQPVKVSENEPEQTDETDKTDSEEMDILSRFDLGMRYIRQSIEESLNSAPKISGKQRKLKTLLKLAPTLNDELRASLCELAEDVANNFGN